MFTIEHEEDETIITILDHEGDLEDVGPFSCGTIEYSFDNGMSDRQQFDLIAMNAQMYYKLMQAWSLPEGTYVVERKNV